MKETPLIRTHWLNPNTETSSYQRSRQRTRSSNSNYDFGWLVNSVTRFHIRSRFEELMQSKPCWHKPSPVLLHRIRLLAVPRRHPTPHPPPGAVAHALRNRCSATATSLALPLPGTLRKLGALGTAGLCRQKPLLGALWLPGLGRKTKFIRGPAETRLKL